MTETELRARLTAMAAEWDASTGDHCADCDRVRDGLDELLAATDPAPDEALCTDESVEALAEAFKVGWHRADELGLPDRTHYGIRNVLGTLGIIAAPAPPPVAPSDQPVARCEPCANDHPKDGCADVGCSHNCEAEVRRLPAATGDAASEGEAACEGCAARDPELADWMPDWRDDETAQMLGVAQYGCRKCGRGAIAERDAARQPWVTVPGKPGYRPAPVHADATDAGDEGVLTFAERRQIRLACLDTVLGPGDAALIEVERILSARLAEVTAERDTHREVADSMSGLWQQEKDRADRLEAMCDRLAGQADDNLARAQLTEARLGEGVVEWGVRWGEDATVHHRPEAMARQYAGSHGWRLVTRTVHTTPWVEVSEP